MEFKAFIQRSSGNVILLYNVSPINSVKDIQSFQEVSNGAFRKKEFRWSVDKKTWTTWQILNQGNIQLVQPTTNTTLYLEFKYVRHSPNNGTISSMTINYTSLDSKYNDIPAEIKPGAPGQVPVPVDDCDVGSGPFIDADLLNGKPGTYYLWRGNHQGTQSISTINGLNQILVNLSQGIQNSITDGFNVDGSGVGVFYQKQNQALYFKRIVSANNDIIISENEGIITLAFDASLASKDPSVNELYQIVEDLQIEINDLSTYVDAQFFNVDVCINDIWSYLENIDVSIGGVNLPESSPGDGEIFKDTSANIFRFRTIRGLGDVSISTNGDYVDIFIDASVSGGPIWSDTDPVTADVGGVVGGDIITLGTNSIEVLEEILYEYFVPATESSLWYQAGGSGPWVPVLNNPQYYEKYVDNPGLFDISSGFQTDSKVTVDLISSFSNATPIGVDFYSDVSQGYWENNIPIQSSAAYENLDIWSAIQNDFKGNIMPDYDASLWSVAFVHAYYYGVVPNNINASNINQTILEQYTKKIIAPKQTNNLVFDSSGMTKIKFVYAYDVSYGELSSVFDVKNDFNVTTSFDKTTLSISGRPFEPGPTTLQVYIKSHWIDVSTFRLIFNI